MKRIKLWLIFGLLLVAAFAFLPEKPLKERIEKALSIYTGNFPQEKVYLQLDKDYYAGGRTIWFKAYITNEYLPTRLSTILYVELLNKKGKVIQNKKLPIKKGGAWGNFTLPVDIAPGDYRIRAFTMWMLNFDQGFLYERDLHIFAPGGDAATDQSAQKQGESDFSVQFFPEGGDLIDSIESVVAFKAIDQDGYPIAIKGEITNAQGTVLDSIHAIHDGMGTFKLTPRPNQNYKARITSEKGMEKTFSLPSAKPYGASLHLINMGHGKVFFQVKKHEKSPENLDKLFLAAQIQGHLVYYAPIDFAQGYTGGLIPVDKNPSGIMQVTLFTPAGVPLAERLVFVRNKNNRLPLELKEDTVSLKPRGKNVFSLTLPDSLEGNFSVAVTDADQLVKIPDQDNIISNLLLSSDIKGFVYNPAWYFSADDSSSIEATRAGLDLVMLTNGWRRFAWQKLLNQQYPELKFAPEARGLQVKGQAMARGKPLETGQISIFLRSPVDSVTYFISGTTEKNGYFLIDDVSFHDTANLYYKVTDTLHKGRLVTVNFAASPAAQGYSLLNTPIHPAKIPATPSLQNYLELAAGRNQTDKYISNRSILLKEVQVKAKRIPKEKSVEERYTSGMFKSDNGYSFDLTDQTLPYTSIFQYLQGRVPGLMVGPNLSDPRVTWRGGTPGFFLDEMPVDAQTISTIPVDDIALIKVYRPPFYGGFGGGSGAIAIYTKKGGDRSFNPGRGFEKYRVAGYSMVKEFYSPDYSVDKKVNELPDNRATLYWNPNLTRDSLTHQISFSFYNTDITKKMRVIIEGIGSKGKIGRIEKIIGP